MPVKAFSEFLPGEVCNFCSTNLIDVLYGKIYKVKNKNIVVHYFCLLMASKIEQNGRDDQGVLGFFPKDILKELQRTSGIECYYCKRKGASIHCCQKNCSRVFHLPCGIAKGSLHQFYGQFDSFCPSHRPKQAIPDKVRLRVKTPCIICTLEISRSNKYHMLWPTCCKPTSFLHRKCVQAMADNAGYYFKCPFCNNTADFSTEMRRCGIYIPEQEASWESEPRAFEELITRPTTCCAETCHCPKGRDYSKKNTAWQVALCKSCGGNGVHLRCSFIWKKKSCYKLIWYCSDCRDTFSNEQMKTAAATVVSLEDQRAIEERTEPETSQSVSVSPPRRRISEDESTSMSMNSQATSTSTDKTYLEEEEEEETDESEDVDVIILSDQEGSNEKTLPEIISEAISPVNSKQDSDDECHMIDLVTPQLKRRSSSPTIPNKRFRTGIISWQPTAELDNELQEAVNSLKTSNSSLGEGFSREGGTSDSTTKPFEVNANFTRLKEVSISLVKTPVLKESKESNSNENIIAEISLLDDDDDDVPLTPPSEEINNPNKEESILEKLLNKPVSLADTKLENIFSNLTANEVLILSDGEEESEPNTRKSKDPALSVRLNKYIDEYLQPKVPLLMKRKSDQEESPAAVPSTNSSVKSKQIKVCNTSYLENDSKISPKPPASQTTIEKTELVSPTPFDRVTKTTLDHAEPPLPSAIFIDETVPTDPPSVEQLTPFGLKTYEYSDMKVISYEHNIEYCFADAPQDNVESGDTFPEIISLDSDDEDQKNENNNSPKTVDQKVDSENCDINKKTSQGELPTPEDPGKCFASFPILENRLVNRDKVSPTSHEESKKKNPVVSVLTIELDSDEDDIPVSEIKSMNHSEIQNSLSTSLNLSGGINPSQENQTGEKSMALHESNSNKNDLLNESSGNFDNKKQLLDETEIVLNRTPSSVQNMTSSRNNNLNNLNHPVNHADRLNCKKSKTDLSVTHKEALTSQDNSEIVKKDDSITGRAKKSYRSISTNLKIKKLSIKVGHIGSNSDDKYSKSKIKQTKIDMYTTSQNTSESSFFSSNLSSGSALGTTKSPDLSNEKNEELHKSSSPLLIIESYDDSEQTSLLSNSQSLVNKVEINPTNDSTVKKVCTVTNQELKTEFLKTSKETSECDGINLFNESKKNSAIGKNLNINPKNNNNNDLNKNEAKELSRIPSPNLELLSSKPLQSLDVINSDVINRDLYKPSCSETNSASFKDGDTKMSGACNNIHSDNLESRSSCIIDHHEGDHIPSPDASNNILENRQLSNMDEFKSDSSPPGASSLCDSNLNNSQPIVSDKSLIENCNHVLKAVLSPTENGLSIEKRATETVTPAGSLDHGKNSEDSVQRNSSSNICNEDGTEKVPVPLKGIPVSVICVTPPEVKEMSTQGHIKLSNVEVNLSDFYQGSSGTSNDDSSESPVDKSILSKVPIVETDRGNCNNVTEIESRLLTSEDGAKCAETNLSNVTVITSSHKEEAKKKPKENIDGVEISWTSFMESLHFEKDRPTCSWQNYQSHSNDKILHRLLKTKSIYLEKFFKKSIKGSSCVILHDSINRANANITKSYISNSIDLFWCNRYKTLDSILELLLSFKKQCKLPSDIAQQWTVIIHGSPEVFDSFYTLDLLTEISSLPPSLPLIMSTSPFVDNETFSVIFEFNNCLTSVAKGLDISVIDFNSYWSCL